MHGVAGGDFALETRRNLRQICFAWVLQVGPLLQVARILGGLALYHTGCADETTYDMGAPATNPRSRSFMGPVYLSNSATWAVILGLIERERLVI